VIGSTDPSYKDPQLPPLLRMDMLLDPPQSSVPWSCQRSIAADWTLESNNLQSALRQHRRGTAGAVAIGNDRVMVTALWSEVVSWPTANDKTDCMVDPQERHK